MARTGSSLGGITCIARSVFTKDKTLEDAAEVHRVLLDSGRLLRVLTVLKQDCPADAQKGGCACGSLRTVWGSSAGRDLEPDEGKQIPSLLHLGGCRGAEDAAVAFLLAS